MKRRIGQIFGVAAFISLLTTLSGFSQELQRQKLPLNHASIDVVRPALEKVLSPQGRFVILPDGGEILVIDTAEGIRAATLALATLEVPPAQVRLDFAFKTGVAAGSMKPQPVESFGDFPFPTAYRAPQIIVNGGAVTVIPAHPMGFRRRAVGSTLETNSSVNPDGSVTVDINIEDTAFEGFINYGSGIFGSGTIGTIPVQGQVGNPRFFQPFLNQSQILMPIFQTTRISTQILLRPTVHPKTVRVDMIPQLKIATEEPGAEETIVTLQKFRTAIDIQNNDVGKINGFEGATAEFNRHFLGAEEGGEGGTAILIRAQISPGTAEPTGDGSPGLEAEATTSSSPGTEPAAVEAKP